MEHRVLAKSHPDAAMTLKERACAQIQEMIESGELERGVRVSNRQLARTLGMSPIPVREAVTQLVSEGLLEQRPGVGTYVVNPSRMQLEDLYELREVLESHAARRAAEVEGEHGLAEMRDSIEMLKRIARQVDGADKRIAQARLFDQCGTADAMFHMALLRRAGNQLAIKTITGLRLLTRVFGRTAPADRLRRLGNIIEAHEKILAAVEAGDAKEAARLMRKHIRTGRRRALKHEDMLRRQQAVASLPIEGPLEKG